VSITKQIHTEDKESHAAQQMGSTMGIDPALAQLNDKDLTHELTSQRAEAEHLDVPADYESAKAAADTDAEVEQTDEIEEARRASWGMPTKDEEMTSDAANTSSTAEAAGLGHS
jgi:hypothetical protein